MIFDCTEHYENAFSTLRPSESTTSVALQFSRDVCAVNRSFECIAAAPTPAEQASVCSNNASGRTPKFQRDEFLASGDVLGIVRGC